MRFPKGRTVGPSLWWRSLGTFLPPRGERCNKGGFICTFLSTSREKYQKSATKGKDPRSSPLETSPLICAHFRSAKMSTRCQVGTSSVTRNGVGATPVAVNLLGCNRTLIAKRLARLLLFGKVDNRLQAGRSDTRRGQPVGLQPNANSRRGSATAFSRKGWREHRVGDGCRYTGYF